MIRYILLIAFFAISAFGQEYKLFKCGDIPLPYKLKIDQCPRNKPCSNIIDGQDAVISGVLHFNIKHKTGILPVTANVQRANGQSETITIAAGDACNLLTKSRCLIQPGLHEVKLPLRVKNVNKGEKLTFSITIRSAKKEPLVCAAVELTAK
uniref:Putative ml domain salivary peptide n=1 Tax=Nyssomyia neivai TaxID=330878 RepID=A0A1L8DQ54_9DIPT